MRRSIRFAALLLATVPGIAQAAEPPCLTEAEFASLAGYALPSVIKGTAARCSAALPANAFLKTGGNELSIRYAGQKARHWPAAKEAFLKLSASKNADTDKLFRGMPDASLQGIIDAMMEGMVSQQIPVDRCGAIDRLVWLLSPLPPENTAELIALAAGIGAKADVGGDRAQVGKLSICKAAK